MSIGSGSLVVCPLSHTFWHPNISLSTFVQSSAFICISFGSFFLSLFNTSFFSSNPCYFQFQDNWYILWQLVQLIPLCLHSSLFPFQQSAPEHICLKKESLSQWGSQRRFMGSEASFMYLPMKSWFLDFKNPSSSMTGIWIHCAYIRTALFWSCSLHHPEVFVVAG